jgi:hypothetical protein
MAQLAMHQTRRDSCRADGLQLGAGQREDYTYKRTR